MGIEKVISVLTEKSSFLVVGHINPESDAIGSGIALALALRGMGKTAEVINRDPLPQRLFFMEHEGVLFQRSEIKEADAVILVDCGSMNRSGLLIKKPKAILINIDHHFTNTLYGDINWINQEASATGEMIYDLLKKMPVVITPSIATALYATLIGDTGSFRNNHTTPKSLRMGAALIECGADPVQIARALFESNSLGKLRLLADVLEKIEVSPDEKTAWIRVTREQLQRAETTDADLEDFIDYPKSLEGIEVAVFFKEIDPRQYQISFRSQGKVDVSALAKRFGGGGHRNAAGCTVVGIWEEISEKVLHSVWGATEAA